MTLKSFVLDGNNFSNIEGFHDEVQHVLTDDFKAYGRGLDAFNDVLRGGFVKYEYDEPFTLVWKNASKSRKELGSNFDDLIDIIERRHADHITLILED